MKAERVDEYHRSGTHFYGKLVIVRYLEDAQKDPKWGILAAEISIDYFKMAKLFVTERYGSNIEILQGVPDLVVRLS